MSSFGIQASKNPSRWKSYKSGFISQLSMNILNPLHSQPFHSHTEPPLIQPFNIQSLFQKTMHLHYSPIIFIMPSLTLTSLTLAFFSLVLASSGPIPAKPLRPQGIIASGNVLPFSAMLNDTRPDAIPANAAAFDASSSGRIEVHWRFETPLFQGDDRADGDLWVRYFEGSSPNPCTSSCFFYLFLLLPLPTR